MKDLVSIIIVNWNGQKWLPECFRSLYKQDWKNFEIIFVDNASTDNSVFWIKQHYPKTKIIVNNQNLGFSDANNLGFKIAKGEFVLFLNNDTRVTRTFLSELVKVLKSSSDIAGAQSKILLMDHPDTHDSVGAYLTPTGFLYHYGFGQKDRREYNTMLELYTAKGACMMFKREILIKALADGSLFDPDYFAYFEETDLCHRIWIMGYRIVYAYRSVIYHKMGATSSKMHNSFIQFHSFKNRINSYIKNLGAPLLLSIMPVHVGMCEFFSIGCFLKGRFELGGAIQRAIFWNIMHLHRTLKIRNHIQRNLRTIPDNLITPIIMRYPKLNYFWALSRGRVLE